jgi:hypothetical protein
MSLGRRSGVNWMRRKALMCLVELSLSEIDEPSARASVVLPEPG